MIDDFLKSKLPEIIVSCKANNVVRLYAFGSIVDGRFREGKSDIDLLVEFDDKAFTKKENTKHLLKLWIETQHILGVKVDLISSHNIRGKFFKKYLEMYKELIYDRSTTTE